MFFLQAGIWQGMESLKAGDLEHDIDPNRRRTVMLLTDGQPNNRPPDGEVAEMRKYFEANPVFAASFQANTFGFGYQLDSKLLLEMAEVGNGTTSFIPDAGA